MHPSMFKKIAFIGHPYHTVTKSSDFFIAILREAGCDVDCYYDDVNYDTPAGAKFDHSILELLTGDNVRNYDSFIVWQTNKIGELLLSKGCDVTFAPMWDDARQIPNAFWRSVSHAKFLSFSADLHAKLCGNGLASHYFQYYPESATGVENLSFETKTAVFWLRRPNSIVNERNLARILKHVGIEKMYLHNVSDIEEERADSFPALEAVVDKLSVSTWFDKKQDLIDLIDRANLYISPREYEGIGMSFLEALARGQVVIGCKRSTYTDYVTHEINGLVTDFNEPLRSYSDAEFEAMSRRALEGVEEGYARWRDNQSRLIALCTDPKYRCPTGAESSAHVANIKQRLA